MVVGTRSWILESEARIEFDLSREVLLERSREIEAQGRRGRSDCVEAEGGLGTGRHETRSQGESATIIAVAAKAVKRGPGVSVASERLGRGAGDRPVGMVGAGGCDLGGPLAGEGGIGAGDLAPDGLDRPEGGETRQGIHADECGAGHAAAVGVRGLAQRGLGGERRDGGEMMKSARVRRRMGWRLRWAGGAVWGVGAGLGSAGREVRCNAALAALG